MSHDRSGPDPLPEGSEAPPAGVRVMAAVRWALVAIAAVAAAGTWIWAARTDPAHAAADARFVCPMHPQVVQASRGSCPVCGMDLVPAGTAAPAAPVAAAAPTGAAAAPGSTQKKAGKYWCPMHPEVSSDDPEARCEQCGGMKLLPREPEPGAAGVPGLVPVDVGSARAQLIGVRTATVARRALRPTLRAPATIAVNESAVSLVASRVTGWIDELRVSQTGARVEKGQVLATVYSPELLTAQQVYLNVIRAQGVASSSYPVDPTKRLDLLGVAKVDLDKLASSGQVSTALPIRAPAAGVVARRSVQAGQYLQPGTELFQIADLSTVWVLAEVPERELGRVARGQAARVTVDAHPGETFEGTVDLVYPSSSAESRTTLVRVALRNPALRLRPGMTGEAELALAGATALAVPVDAVVDTGEHQYAFVARGNGQFEPRAVRVGARDGDAVEIREGLADGEQVVTQAGFLVDAESRLRAAIQQFE